jgi:hypothetical protein
LRRLRPSLRRLLLSLLQSLPVQLSVQGRGGCCGVEALGPRGLGLRRLVPSLGQDLPVQLSVQGRGGCISIEALGPRRPVLSLGLDQLSTQLSAEGRGGLRSAGAQGSLVGAPACAATARQPDGEVRRQRGSGASGARGAAPPRASVQTALPQGRIFDAGKLQQLLLQR